MGLIEFCILERYISGNYIRIIKIKKLIVYINEFRLYLRL